ncbi:MAG: long-chain fatty acid--CoA ligase [Bacteroidales bacterium]|jgi:long-chain acyl-CoA synthetase
MKEHIAHMIRDRASRYGSREVFRHREAPGGPFKSYSWSAFSSDADRVSRALISLGFGHGSLVGIYSDNRIQWPITDIGILGIRAVVVPFFGTASIPQLKYIIDETNMQIMFAGNHEQLEKARGLLDPVTSLQKIVLFQGAINVDDNRCLTWNDFLKLGDDPLFETERLQLYEEAQPMDLATILYTSGTTGEPKGVMLGHDNFMECFKIHDERLDITEKDVSMCFLPLSHIFERTWSFYIMYRGAVNAILENPREVIEVLPAVNPTLMCTVPRFFEKTYDGIMAETAKWPAIKRKIFNRAIAAGHQRNEYRRLSEEMPFSLKWKTAIAEKLVLRKLRNIFGKNIRTMPCSGAAIREDLLRFFHATGIFVNFGYGATETTATVSCYRTDRWEYESCGTVMPGVMVKLSENNEIMVKGPTVFRGYYNKPEATKEALQDGWYMTGDKGKFTADGNLVMTDRLKDLFKTSGGKYVSPQMIELMLGQDNLIEQIIAIGDNRRFISALIVPAFDQLKVYAKKLNIDINIHEQLITHPEIIKLFQDRIDQLQAGFAPHERVVRFTLLPEPFSIENNAMTSTLKLRRRVITEKYRDLIEKMYSTA